MITHTKSGIVALLFGTAALTLAIPAQAEWGGGYGGTPSVPNQGTGGSSNCVPGATNCKSGGSTRPSTNTRPGTSSRPGGWNQGQSGYGGGQGGGPSNRPTGGWNQTQGQGGYGGGSGTRPTGGWNQGGSYGGSQGRPGGWNQSQGGYGGDGYGPGGYGNGPKLGKVCYNFAGKPYIYRGRGRCPIS